MFPPPHIFVTEKQIDIIFCIASNYMPTRANLPYVQIHLSVR